MDQSEDREDGVPPSTTTVSGEHENQTRDQRMENKDMILDELILKAAEEAGQRSRRRRLARQVSAGTRPERPLETGSEPEPKVNPAESPESDTEFKGFILPSSYMNLTQSDGREEPPPYETTETHNKRTDDGLYKTTDYNELYQKPYSYYMPYITNYPPVGPVSDGIRPERPLETGSVPEPKVNPAEHHQRMILPERELFSGLLFSPVSAGIRPERSLASGSEQESKAERRQRKFTSSSYMNLTQSDCREKQSKYETTETHNKRMENKLSNMTDCNGLYWNQYPYYRPDITYYPPVGPVSAGTRPERPLETGSVPEPKVNPAEHHQRKILPSSYIDLTQSDGREEQSKDETTETHNKRVENEVRMLTDLIKECKDSLKTRVKLTDDGLRNMANWIQESEDEKMEFVKLIWKYGESENDTDNKDSQLSALKRMKTRLEKLLTKIKVDRRSRRRQHARPVSAGIRPDRPLETGPEPEPKVNPAEHHQRKFTSTENKLSNMADLMKEREDVLMAQNKFMMDKFCNMVDLMKEREDVLMAHMKQMENKLDLMKEREDALMAHMKQMDNKLSNMTDSMKPREDVLMAQNKLKRLQDEGSDSTEPEPREEPSSHSDSGRSSCMSFSSDRSISRLIGFKGSRPSALKRKRLEDEGSDSTESEHEPRDEPSSHSDSDSKSSCVSFKSDDSMNRPIDFKGSRPSALKRKRLEEEGSD